MITEFFGQWFSKDSFGSRGCAKRRLRLVLAHDRATLNALTLEKMRHDIILVVSKYVELEDSSLEFFVKTDSRMTVLVVNLPIKKILVFENEV